MPTPGARRDDWLHSFGRHRLASIHPLFHLGLQRSDQPPILLLRFEPRAEPLPGTGSREPRHEEVIGCLSHTVFPGLGCPTPPSADCRSFPVLSENTHPLSLQPGLSRPQGEFCPLCAPATARLPPRLGLATQNCLLPGACAPAAWELHVGRDCIRSSPVSCADIGPFGKDKGRKENDAPWAPRPSSASGCAGRFLVSAS